MYAQQSLQDTLFLMLYGGVAYFAQQGITYNAYINRLRVDHFMRLYHDSIKSDSPAVATQLAQKSGFRSYSTFATAFKYFNGVTVTAWMKTQV